MNRLLSQIAAHPAHAPAIQDDNACLNYAELHAEVAQLSSLLQDCKAQAIGIALDNGAPWVVADLAALSLNIPCIPLPSFFSQQQLRHVLQDAGVNVVICTHNLPFAAYSETHTVAGCVLFIHHIKTSSENTLPANCAKITYTSGTTSEPKGVCLSADSMLAVADSLYLASEATPNDRHVCVLPLSLLLANVSAVYAPLSVGGCCYLPSLHRVGWKGASQLDPVKLVTCLREWQANSTVFVPQLLHATLAVLQQIGGGLPDMRFIAVGGAPLAQGLYHAATQAGLPVFEGYGLSECASVVSMNTSSANRAGSVGKVLPHAEVRIAEDGEILVRGTQMQGYLHQTEVADLDGFYPTGDLGRFDEDGFLYLAGRKKTCFITAYGRNVAPEWVEQELCAHPAIAQAVVYGEALPYNFALVQARQADVPSHVLAAAVAQVNQWLPDYAQVRHWLPSDGFFPDGLPLTTGGMPQRQAINPVLQRYLAKQSFS